jgi:hypothetical protein
VSDSGRQAGPVIDPTRRRRTVAAVVTVVLAIVGLSTLAYAANEGSGAPQSPAALGSPASGDARSHRPPVTSRQAARGPVMSRSRPVRLAVPSVKIDTGLLRLGLNNDGSLQVPWKPLLAGWYTGSPTPGELGPSVIAGHVDSWATGPAVFYRLGQVAARAHVEVTRADGSVADFRVTRVASYPKVAFPAHLVYGNVDRAELRLITCGTWNSSTQEYDNNVIVFARLVRAD